MNKYYLLAMTFFCLAFAKAQSFSVSGQAIDEFSKDPLESATVYLERAKDSTLITYTITDADGKFKLEGDTSYKDVRLNISYVGYKEYQKLFTIEEPDTELGSIEMEEDISAIDAVVIKSRAPITIKKDTLEFNVKSFKTKADANVEDLLKQLPGVEVEEDGTIKVNGKPVKNILVNGKPFFGNDPTIATRNLTKEMIEKVQIVDSKTRDEEFTGEEGDTENKTINLTINEENNKGSFGRVAAGGGTDDRFEYAGLYNYFDNDLRLSALAGGNNINSSGFSFGEIQKMFGGGSSIMISDNGGFAINGRGFGLGQGIVNSRSGGANYADSWGKKTEITADYFYSGATSTDASRTDRENILPDDRFFSNSLSRTKARNENHEINVDFDTEIDSTLLINYTPSVTFGRAENSFTGTEESRGEDGVLRNTSSNENGGENRVRNFENQISFTKKLDTMGGFLKLRMTSENSRTDSENFLLSTTETFGTTPSSLVRDQFTDGEQSLDSYYARLQYRLPIINKKLFLDLSYSWRNNVRNSRRSTFDFDGSEYSLFNSDQSTDFTFKNIRNTPYASVRYEAEKWSLGMGAGYVFRTLSSEDGLRPTLDIERDFTALEGNINTNIQFSPRASLYAGYNLSNNPPGLQQLQPQADVSNPLNTIQGNPDLKPSNSHSLYAGFNNFNFQKGMGYNVYLNAGVTQDQVVAKSQIDENFIRTTTYDNVQGNYRLNGSVSANRKFKLDSIRSLRVRVGVSGNTNRSINFNNDVKYRSQNSSITPSTRVTLDWKKFINLTLGYNLRLSKADYGLDSFEDQEFINHRATATGRVTLMPGLEWNNNIVYQYNPNVAEGFEKDSWFWNASLGYTFLKKKATATLKVYDLLNQNTNARRSSSANFIQDSQSTVLQQYFMLGFSYKFNSLGSKGEVSEFSFDF